MAKKVVKKKKKKFGAGGFTGSKSRELSSLRPRHVEKDPPCRVECHSANDVRTFVTKIAQAERLGKDLDQAYEEAWRVYTNTSPFPSILGRVCPAPCEKACNRTEIDGAVGINKIERSIGDFGLEKGLALGKLTEETRSETIAVVGAGPAGLSCAYQMARRGYSVTVYESMEKPGGMLLWGIPAYRLPESVLEGEIQKILDLGVELKCNVKVGQDVSLDDLRSQFDAVFVGIGAQQGVRLGVEGEEAINIFSGVDFLNRFHHGEILDLGDKVAIVVVGGGDTAIDSARICRRLGCEVTILYRRTLKEMPAIEREIEEAQAEGVKIEFLAAPIGFAKEGNRVTAMKSIRMELGEPDESGRRRPVPIEGSEFEIEVSAVISAISQAPDFSGFEAIGDAKTWIQVDDNGMTRVEGVYSGGDVVNLDIVTTAIGHGRRAAEAMDHKLRGTEPESSSLPVIKTDKMRLDHYERAARVEAMSRGVDERLADVDLEVDQTLPADQIVAEARRCMSCGYCFDCEKCWMFCQDSAIDKPLAKGQLYSFKMQNCTGCKKCAEECPCGFIDME
jgi:NADPH-dependent glutamate synthase beta subunit-like oxidoreductase/Pyruvate/2-oxoacid:ferredoxin oxidoreductase delta subunit